MELIQIIITTLKLFVLISAIVVLISYSIYKLKERNRSKPYANIQEPGIITKPVPVMHDEIYEKKPMRFQIMNTGTVAVASEANEPIYEKPKVKNYAASSHLKYKSNLPKKESFDIYNSYSNSNFEPMYKVKL